MKGIVELLFGRREVLMEHGLTLLISAATFDLQLHNAI